MNDYQDALKINWNNKSILIVEDDKFNAIIIVNFIKKTKASFQIADTGEKSVEMALSLNPDIILMDIKLPGINGLEAARQIKKLMPSVIIIAQTAFATENDRVEALQAGCDDFISKPIRFEKLIRTLSKFLE